MQSPNNIQGNIAELIMFQFSEFNENAYAKLSASKYNSLYNKIYSILTDNFYMTTCGRKLSEKQAREWYEETCIDDVAYFLSRGKELGYIK